MRKMYEKPMLDMEEFFANEYVAWCGQLEGSEDWLVASGKPKTEVAYERPPIVPGMKVEDMGLWNEHDIYMGSFYRYGDEKQELIPDSTGLGHQDMVKGATGQWETHWGAMRCARGDNGDAWGYHYHFSKVTNQS